MPERIVRVEVECDDSEAIEALLSSKPPAGVQVERRRRIQKAADGALIALALLKVFGSISAGVVANYIYHAMARKKPKKIRINRTEVEFGQGEITRVLTKELKIDEH